MSSHGPGTPPELPEDAQSPRVGVDEWVATYEGRRERGKGVSGFVQAELERLPRPVSSPCSRTTDTSSESGWTRCSTCCLRSA